MMTGVLRLVVARDKSPEEVVASGQMMSLLPQRCDRTLLGWWRIDIVVGNSIPEQLWREVISAYADGLIDRAFFASSDGPGYRDIRDLRRRRLWWRFR